MLKDKYRVVEDFLFLILTIPLFSGITGAFRDIIYHSLHHVDSFFSQHIWLYTSIYLLFLLLGWFCIFIWLQMGNYI